MATALNISMLYKQEGPQRKVAALLNSVLAKIYANWKSALHQRS